MELKKKYSGKKIDIEDVRIDTKPREISELSWEKAIYRKTGLFVYICVNSYKF